MAESAYNEQKSLVGDFDGYVTFLADIRELKSKDDIHREVNLHDLGIQSPANRNFWCIMALRNMGLSSFFATVGVRPLANGETPLSSYIGKNSNGTDSSPFYRYLKSMPSFAAFVDEKLTADWPLSHIILGFPSSLLSLLEAIPAVVGALFSTLHAEVVFKRMGAQSTSARIFWGLLSAVTSIFDMVVAQPLFFISNVINNIKGVVDGAINALVGFGKCVLFQGTDRLKAGMAGLVESAAKLVCNAVTLGIAAAILYFGAPVILPAFGLYGAGLMLSSVGAMASAPPVVTSAVASLGALVLGGLRTVSAKIGFTGLINRCLSYVDRLKNDSIAKEGSQNDNVSPENSRLEPEVPQNWVGSNVGVRNRLACGNPHANAAGSVSRRGSDSDLSTSDSDILPAEGLGQVPASAPAPAPVQQGVHGGASAGLSADNADGNSLGSDDDSADHLRFKR